MLRVLYFIRCFFLQLLVLYTIIKRKPYLPGRQQWTRYQLQLA